MKKTVVLLTGILILSVATVGCVASKSETSAAETEIETLSVAADTEQTENAATMESDAAERETEAETIGIPENPDYELYADILAEAYGAEGNSDYNVYFLKDIDGNGIYEMIMQCGGDDGSDYWYEVYTIDNEGVKLLETNEGNDCKYGDFSKNVHTIDSFFMEGAIQ